MHDGEHPDDDHRQLQRQCNQPRQKGKGLRVRNGGRQQDPGEVGTVAPGAAAGGGGVKLCLAAQVDF